MAPDTPPRLSTTLTAPSPQQLSESPSSSNSRPSSSHSALRPTASTESFRIDHRHPSSNRGSRSRSPSPSVVRFPSSAASLDVPPPSAASALVAAGLGLVGSLPPSPVLSIHPAFHSAPSPDDDIERLAPIPGLSPPLEAESRGSSEQRRRTPSVVGFVEPDFVPSREVRAESRGERGRRERKRSFIGLGFGGNVGGGAGGEDEGSPTTARGGFARLFSSSSSASNGAGMSSEGYGADSQEPQRPPFSASSPSSSSVAPPPPHLPNPVPPPPRKASGPKALLRRAKSFGTSPTLNPSSTFASQPAYHPPPPSSAPLVAPHPYPLPRTSTTSLDPSLASTSVSTTGGGYALRDSLSPSASGFSTPLTPSSPYPHLFASHTSSSSSLPPSSHGGTALAASSGASTMVLPEAVPSQPHWLLMANAPPPAVMASSSSLAPDAPAKEKERRRSADEGRSPAGEGDKNGKGKGKESAVSRKKTTRRATLGGFFGRKDSKAASAAERDASFEAQRSSAEGVGAHLAESPGGSPALGGGPSSVPASRENSTGGGGASMPSLPSLPSLQLSSNPYRMSWAFGGGSSPNSSPNNSPARNGTSSPARRLSFINISPSHSPSPSSRASRSTSFSRPALSITTTPPNASPPPASPSPAPTSPTKPSPLSSSILASPNPSSSPPQPTRTLILPPPLISTKSSDSATTLYASPASPPRGSLSRAHSASSPPALRRSASYVPPPSFPSPSSSSYAPLTRSPLASPTYERDLSLGIAPPPHPPPSQPYPPSNSSPSLAKTLIRTRQARSHSDASDRRSPSLLPTQPVPYAGGRAGLSGPLSAGGNGGGGYFSQRTAAPSRSSNESGSRRPSTSGESNGGGGGGGRTSVFGSLGSFFHSSSSNSTTASSTYTTSGGGGGSYGGFGSQSMSRSTSAATATSANGGVSPMGTPTFGGGSGEASEFGALFDGAGGGGKERSASATRPGAGRRRGLSVGAGIGSLFGGGGGSGSGRGDQGGALHGRERSGSGSSAVTSSSGLGSVANGGGGGGLAPPSFDNAGSNSNSVGGRVRALTDPNRRFSMMAPSGSSSSLVPPPSSRPGTSDGSFFPSFSSPAASPSKISRSRGASVSSAAAGGGPSSPTLQNGGRALPPKERKVPQPRLDEGETPEDWVRRLMEGAAGRVVRRRKAVEEKEKEGEKLGGEVEKIEEVEEVEDAEAQAEVRNAAESEYEDVEEGRSEPLPKGEITKALAASSDDFHLSALTAYLRLFPFSNLPLDIALRVFLSAASLPPETQQIDRVMEAFARRWCECNPGMFVGTKVEGRKEDEGETVKVREKEAKDSDIPYVLAFSMVMLNTDHFNPNAKSKMTKADYVKNTRIDGVAPELLEYLYDQITLAPFIFVDSNSVDEFGSSSSLFTPSASSASLLSGSIGPVGPAAFAPSASSSGFFGGGREKGKVDPYHLIATGQTQRFRVDVESHIPAKSPFSFTGTTAFFNSTTLHSVFARAPILQITTRSRSSSKSSPTPQITSSAAPPLPGSPSPILSGSTLAQLHHPALDGSPLTSTMSNGTFVDPPTKKKDRTAVSSLKITKIGLLSRKEDLAEGGKKAASRKWKGWSVVLTGSQLLFFKDPHFAASLQHSLDTAAAASDPKPDENHVLVFSIQTPFKPDAVLSLANSAAIYDSSYSKYRNVFRLVAPAGRQYLFQAHDADNLNAWLHAINYAASFKTVNCRIRALQPSSSSATNSNGANSPVNASRSPQPLSSSILGLPQPNVHLEASSIVGSQGSMTDAVSPKSSAEPFKEDQTVQPSSAQTNDVDDSLPKSLQDALTASANGLSDSQRTVIERAPSVQTPERVASPLPSEASFPTAPPVTARADFLRVKINELDAEINRIREGLQVDLRLAKHLAILTPFKSATRERVLTAIPPIEKRVRHARMSLAKLVCYREVLSRDLLVEDRETERLVRKHSHRRTNSRRTSALSGANSPTRHYPVSPRQSSHHPSSHGDAFSPLARSSSSLRPPRASFHAHSDNEHTPRNSFDSATESLNQPHSLTDDELDRLHVRSPPPMQRSRTESDWQFDRHQPPPLVGSSSHHHHNGVSHGLGFPLSAEHNFVHHSEDELEVPPTLDSNGGAGTPIRKRSTDPAEMFVRGINAPPSAFPRSREDSREVLSASSLAAPPTLEQRHSH